MGKIWTWLVPLSLIALGVMLGGGEKKEGVSKVGCDLVIGSTRCTGKVMELKRLDRGGLILTLSNGELYEFFIKESMSQGLVLGRRVSLELVSRDGEMVESLNLISEGTPQTLYCTTAKWNRSETNWTQFGGDKAVVVNLKDFPELGRVGTKGVVLEGNELVGVIEWPEHLPCREGVGTPYSSY